MFIKEVLIGFGSTNIASKLKVPPSGIGGFLPFVQIRKYRQLRGFSIRSRLWHPREFVSGSPQLQPPGCREFAEGPIAEP
jgi:hypothetical protein